MKNIFDIDKTEPSWREKARPIIAAALKATEGKSEEEIKKALFDAYPWGERIRYPYKVWLSEIKKQRELMVKRSKWDQGILFKGALIE